MKNKERVNKITIEIELDIDSEDYSEDTEVVVNEVARLINEGFTSGTDHGEIERWSYKTSNRLDQERRDEALRDIIAKYRRPENEYGEMVAADKLLDRVENDRGYSFDELVETAKGFNDEQLKQLFIWIRMNNEIQELNLNQE